MSETNGNGHAGNGKHKPGPDTIRTPEAEAVILRAVKSGHSLRSAAWLAGFPESTVRTWMRKDPQLRAAVSLAKAAGEDKAVEAMWMKIDSGNWRAIEFFLSRRSRAFREQKRVAVKHSGSVGNTGPDFATPRTTVDGEEVVESVPEYVKRLQGRARELGLLEEE